jgi:mannose/fructose/N-acetylgalactosamine-specific phosphotransferase system component IIB
MSFELVRIDDRLIHGQVTVAWGSRLNPDRLLLVNDEVAACDWRCELYSEPDAFGVEITILSVDDFAEALERNTWEGERVFVIVETPGDLLRLIGAGLRVPVANVGGMHHAEGKRELLPYVFVDDDDVDAMKAVIDSGTRLEARDVPQATPVDMAELLAARED